MNKCPYGRAVRVRACKIVVNRHRGITKKKEAKDD